MKTEKCDHCKNREGLFEYKYIGQLCSNCEEFMGDFYRRASFDAIKKAEKRNFIYKVFDSIWLIVTVVTPFIISKIEPSLIQRSFIMSGAMLLFYSYLHNFRWPSYKIQ